MQNGLKRNFWAFLLIDGLAKLWSMIHPDKKIRCQKFAKSKLLAANSTDRCICESTVEMAKSPFTSMKKHNLFAGSAGKAACAPG